MVRIGVKGRQGREFRRDVADLVPAKKCILEGELGDAIECISSCFEFLVLEDVAEAIPTRLAVSIILLYSFLKWPGHLLDFQIPQQRQL